MRKVHRASPSAELDAKPGKYSSFLRDTHTQSADLFLTCDYRKAKRVEHAGRNEAWVNSNVCPIICYF